MTSGLRISGIFDVDKPADMTSHDVVKHIRQASGQRRVGHAGTLDPFATGVLLICMGEATRMAEYLLSTRKVYRAWIHLGVATDTYDAAGKVISQTDKLSLAVSEIEKAVSTLIGQIEQVPPMYSAVKHEGRPLYRWARRGIEIARKARAVEIYAFQIKEWAPPILTAEIACSKGTYIRSLAHDLGGILGCGAHLARLVRIACGPFTLANAVTMPELMTSLQHGTWQPYLYPMDIAVADYPAWTVDKETARRIAYGQQVEVSPQDSVLEPDTLCRAYNKEGQFIAVLKYDSSTRRWQPEKVFTTNR